MNGPIASRLSGRTVIVAAADELVDGLDGVLHVPDRSLLAKEREPSVPHSELQNSRTPLFSGTLIR